MLQRLGRGGDASGNTAAEAERLGAFRLFRSSRLSHCPKGWGLRSRA